MEKDDEFTLNFKKDYMILPVHIINLKQRINRRQSIINEFKGKPFFNITIHEPITHSIGSYSLWLTFRKIVKECKDRKLSYFIFCEDDHVFTKDFPYEALINNIQQAISLKAEILSGGVSWFDLPIKATSNLFYIDQFNGMQFTVIFESVYDKILDHDYTEETVTDICLSNICSNIFVMWPFLSVQKEFGYSDVTSFNNVPKYVEGLFEKTIKEFRVLEKVENYYG